jgi:hypothetical protein
MGLHEQSTSNSRFLSVKHGAICLEHPAKPQTEEDFERAIADGFTIVQGEVNNVPYKKAVKKFGSLDGRIVKIEWYDRTHGGDTYRGLKIHVKDGGEHYQLDLPFEKRQYDYFTKVAENIDYSEPVEFVAWQDKTDERVTAFGVKQGGAFVPWKYTKDNPGDCPPPIQSRTTKKWNFDDQREWLLDRVLNYVAPAVEEMNQFDEPTPEYSGEDAPKGLTAQASYSGGFDPRKAPVGVDDDIPF